MNTNFFKSTVLVLGATFLISTASFAQSGEAEQRTPPTFAELLEVMDANEDGKLSEEEVTGRLKDHFAKIDTNEDGFITEEEFDNAPKPKGKGKE